MRKLLVVMVALSGCGSSNPCDSVLCGTGSTCTVNGNYGECRAAATQPSCGTITGQYSVTGYEQSGNCGPGAYPDTATIAKSGNSYSITLASFGQACPAVLDGCLLTASCTLTTSIGNAQVSFAYTFSSNGFTGTDTEKYSVCTSTYRETGTRK